MTDADLVSPADDMEPVEFNQHSILYVDDDPDNRERFFKQCRHRFHVLHASFVEEADEILKREKICILITDNRMPWGKGQPNYENTGLTYLARVRKHYPHILRTLVTFVPEETRRLSFELLNEAGVDAWIDAWAVNDWAQKVQELVEKHVSENVYCRSAVPADQSFAEMVGRSRAMQDLRKRIKRVCERGLKEPILVVGESGVGKELVARTIHRLKFGTNKPWVALSVANLSGDTARSALFGHRKGTFTDAVEDRAGAFESASGGTLLLDDVDNLDLNIQPLLLRTLQEKEIVRNGEEHRPARPVDVQLICTTNKDLERLVRQGKFRNDLYNRIAWFVIEVPPLRRRTEDIWALAAHFLRARNEKAESDGKGRSVNGIEIQAFRALLLHNWMRGNVRELQKVIHSACLNASTNLITADDLPRRIMVVPDRIPDDSGSDSTPWQWIDGEAENYKHLNRMNAVIRALIQAKGNKKLASGILGINLDPETGRVTLQNYLKQRGILERMDQECGRVVLRCWEETEGDLESAAYLLNQALMELSPFLPEPAIEGKEFHEIMRRFGLSGMEKMIKA